MTILKKDDGSNFTAGDNLQVERDVTGVPTGDPLVKAWMTFKVDASVLDASATLQKIITVNAVQGTGQITQNGSELQGNGTATTIFQLTAADTALLGSERTYFWDIQAKTVAGDIYTPDKGSIKLDQGYTDATS